jgi:all-trans-8'-apo-beta-carotenal 15,15'-oxygenase
MRQKLALKSSMQLLAVLSLFAAGVAAFLPEHGQKTRLCRQKALFASVDSSQGNLATSTAQSPDMEAYSSAYRTVYDELPCKDCKPSEGKIPEDLVGSYFRSGPAMFTAGSILPPKQSIVQPKTEPVPDGEDPDRMVAHPFEGDGAILGVTFSGTGSATARFRYVRTAGFTNERKKGRKLYSAMESTRELGPQAAVGLGNDLSLPLYRHHLQPGLNKLRKNTSNTRSFYWGKRLITLWEGGLPYKLDALALSTEGRSQLGGVLQETDPFGCKGVIDSKNDRALFYSNNQNPQSSDLTLYEFNSNFRLVEEKDGKVEAKLPGFAMISDFCATENYAVFVQPNAVANGMQFMFNKEPGKVISVEKGPSTVHLIARVGSSKKPKSLTIPFDGAVDAELQFCNAYEEGDLVIFDAIRSDGSNLSASNSPKWPWANSLEEYTSTTPKRSLWRYTVDTKRGSVSKKMLSDLHCSFGVVNQSFSAQKHRYIYATVGRMGSEVAPPQGIAKFDCETEETQVWIPKEYEFCGEPMYAAKKGGDKKEEGDGYILSVLYNGKSKESEMIILRAKDIKSGPIARIPLGISIPHGLFGCFTTAEEANWDSESIDRRAKLSDKMESKGNMWNEVKSDFSGLGLRLDDIEEIFPDLV